MAKHDRFKKKSSDRSGFDYTKNELVKDGPYWVHPDEKDEPPPSKISLGGEGDINQGTYFRTSTSTAIDADRENPTFYITAADGITPNYEHPYMRVTGSNNAVTITADPRIVAGTEGKFLTLFCTDSSITIQNGNGVATMGSTTILLQSGGVATFIYTTGGNVWQETSRVSGDVGIGG